MLSPKFSRQRVENVPTLGPFDVGMASSGGGERQTRREIVSSENHKRYFENEQTIHSVEKYINDRSWCDKESTSPREKRRIINKEARYNSSSMPKAKLDLSKELHDISKSLQLCHQDFASTYMQNIIQEIDVHKSSNEDQVFALKELFRQLNTEMVHLREILPQYSEIIYAHNGKINHIANPVDNLSSRNSVLCDDLVHFKGPLTENTVITTLQERFNEHSYHTRIGPVLLAVNPFGSSESEENIEQKANDNSPFLKTLIQQSLQQLFHTQTSQVLILSGESGSGKSFTAQMLIHQLLYVTCGGFQTDLAKQLLASVTVLRSLGKAKTINNAESSRMAKLYEFYFSNTIISKAKIRCYPLDLSRIVRPREGERNFHIFYQLFAGLSPKDRAKLQLQTHNAQELRYLFNYPVGNQTEIKILQKEFQSWKLALSVLGIPFTDVTRVLAVILLLGNVQFMEKSAKVLEVQGGDFELKAVAVLLGVAYTSLFRGLTKRSKLIRGEIIVQPCTAAQANSSRDALAKALYSRTLSAIVRRCNSSRKSTSSLESSPNSSSESLSKNNPVSPESTNQAYLNVSNVSSLSTPSNNDNNIGDDDIIGIADLFGFENSKCNGMEQICTNLCSETIQHFYTTHVFKSPEGYCREEGLQTEVDIDYVDNSLCIELLTCQGTGILAYLDNETLDVDKGSAEMFLDKLHSKHNGHKKFFTRNCERLAFGVVHHTSEVVYNAKELFLSNDDAIVDEVIRMFSGQHCNFGFVTHLFATDLKSTLTSETVHGEHFLHKISQSSNTPEASQSATSSSPIRTFSQDFQSKLDGLLKTLVQAKPWFILCLKSNSTGNIGVFDREIVSQQTKSLQIFETVYLTRSDYTHRMRILAFAQRYFAFQDDQLTQEDALDIVQSYQQMMSERKNRNPNKILFIGRKHVFFSELVWQDLERDRREKEAVAEQLKQKKYLNEETILLKGRELGTKDNPYFSPDELPETPCVLADIDVSTPPPIPKRRSYTVIDNKKISFPQTRIMKNDYRDITNGEEVVFNYGEMVTVTGASPKAGFLTVKTKHKIGWVPYKLTKLLNDSS